MDSHREDFETRTPHWETERCTCVCLLFFHKRELQDIQVCRPSIVPPLTCRHSQLEAHLQKQDEDLHKEVNDRIDGRLDFRDWRPVLCTRSSDIMLVSGPKPSSLQGDSS